MVTSVMVSIMITMIITMMMWNVMFFLLGCTYRKRGMKVEWNVDALFLLPMVMIGVVRVSLHISEIKT